MAHLTKNRAKFRWSQLRIKFRKFATMFATVSMVRKSRWSRLRMQITYMWPLPWHALETSKRFVHRFKRFIYVMQPFDHCLSIDTAVEARDLACIDLLCIYHAAYTLPTHLSHSHPLPLSPTRSIMISRSQVLTALSSRTLTLAPCRSSHCRTSVIS